MKLGTNNSIGRELPTQPQAIGVANHSRLRGHMPLRQS